MAPSLGIRSSPRPFNLSGSPTESKQTKSLKTWTSFLDGNQAWKRWWQLLNLRISIGTKENKHQFQRKHLDGFGSACCWSNFRGNANPVAETGPSKPPKPCRISNGPRKVGPAGLKFNCCSQQTNATVSHRVPSLFVCRFCVLQIGASQQASGDRNPVEAPWTNRSAQVDCEPSGP